MNTHHPGDRVAFTLGATNYTGTITGVNDDGSDYLVETPAGTTWSVPAEALAALPAEPDDLLAVITAPDGAAVAAVQDRTDPLRGIDIACSMHGRFCTLRPYNGATKTERQQLREQAIATVAGHAADIRHAPVHRLSATGGQP